MTTSDAAEWPEGDISRSIIEVSEDRLIRSIFRRLQSELPPRLCYHSFEHTVEVVREAVTYGAIDNLPERDLLILGIGAAFHDAGFLESEKNHEERGARMAKGEMEKDGRFSAAEVQRVESLILDTGWIARPSSERIATPQGLSGYLIDADVSNLGRDDYFEKTELLSRELGINLDAFFRRSLEFAISHRWLTRPARILREKMKEINIQLLQRRLSG